MHNPANPVFQLLFDRRMIVTACSCPSAPFCLDYIAPWSASADSGLGRVCSIDFSKSNAPDAPLPHNPQVALKHQPQRKLNLPRARPRAGYLSGIAAARSVLGEKIQGRNVEIGPVEDVEEFGSKFQRPAFSQRM